MTWGFRSSFLFMGMVSVLIEAVGGNGSVRATQENARPAGLPAAPAGMVWVPGGEFSLGTTEAAREVCGGNSLVAGDAEPLVRVYVVGFWMDATEVTNEQFAAFVAATGYVTIASPWRSAT